jgi:hypothetical protein
MVVVTIVMNIDYTPLIKETGRLMPPKTYRVIDGKE